MLGVAACLTLGACDDCGVPPVPEGHDPQGNDLVAGAIVAAVDTRSGGVQIYKLVELNDFPPPLGTELVLNAYAPKTSDFKEAARLWRRRASLAISLPRVRVYKHMFLTRDYRVLAVEPVSSADRNAPIVPPERATP
jgi:hypothetical protein